MIGCLAKGNTDEGISHRFCFSPPTVERGDSGILSQHKDAASWVQVRPAHRPEHAGGAFQPPTDARLLRPGAQIGYQSLNHRFLISNLRNPPVAAAAAVFDLLPSSFRAPAWPSRSRRPTSSARLSSQRTVSETFSTWPRSRASTRTTKMSNAAKPPVATRGFHTCPVGPTWPPWPRTSERTKPKAARLCDWWGEGRGQSTGQAGSYGAALIPACLRPPIFLERGFISFTWCSCYWNTLHQRWKINA